MQHDDFLSKRPWCKTSRLIDGIFETFLVLALIFGANATPCGIVGGCGSGSGDWEASAQAFLSSDVPGSFIPSNAQKMVAGIETKKELVQNNTTNESDTSTRASGHNAQSVYRPDDFPNGRVLKPLPSVSSSDVILDVSNTNRYTEQPHIRSAIHLPSKSFMYENGTIKPESELAKILGEAGISRDNRVVIYGDNISSGESTFVFWIMRLLGQENVSVLDGNLEDWAAAKLPLESLQNKRPAANYPPILNFELLANYQNVTSSYAQIVDASPFTELSKDRMPNSISMDAANVLENGMIKNSDALANLFSKLDKKEPVIVYSSDYIRASLLWYALQLMGYNAEIYTKQKWATHPPVEKSQVNATNPSSSKPSNPDAIKYKKLGG